MGRTSDADDRLMTAALELIWEESYGAVTIDDICKRADVKKGSFYYFFDSKAALAVAALEKLWRDEWKPAMDERFSPSRNPVERIRIYIDALYQKQAQVKQDTGKVLGCPVFCVGCEVSTHEIDVGAKVREIVARKRKYTESAIRDAMAEGLIDPCDPAEKALALACMIEGAISQSRIINDLEPLRILGPMAMDLLRVRTAPAASVPAVAGTS